jgi:hypothetical protein
MILFSIRCLPELQTQAVNSIILFVLIFVEIGRRKLKIAISR